MSIALIVIAIALYLVLSYLCFAYYSELKWAEDEIRALRQTIDAMNNNRPLQNNRPSLNETLILRK